MTQAYADPSSDPCLPEVEVIRVDVPAPTISGNLVADPLLAEILKCPHRPGALADAQDRG